MHLSNVAIKIIWVKRVNATSLWHYTPNLRKLTVASLFSYNSIRFSWGVESFIYYEISATCDMHFKKSSCLSVQCLGLSSRLYLDTMDFFHILISAFMYAECS